MTLLTIKQVVGKVAMSKSTVFKLIKEGHFPKQYPIPNTTNSRWLDEDIENYIRSVTSLIKAQDNITSSKTA